MLSASGEWDKGRLHYYPVMDWSTRQVWSYNRVRQLPRPAEYTYLRRSWSGFLGEDLFAIRAHFPADYKKIIDVFPFADIITRRYELFADRNPKNKRSTKLQGAIGQSVETEGSDVQPASH